MYILSLTHDELIATLEAVSIARAWNISDKRFIELEKLCKLILQKGPTQ